ncbi:hypothetical protein [Nitrosophilus labii]|uniref:hypothetical protein n=1 Tax=Nitrosophilus labii TaxID=2706014 RepID=UPI0016572237|nr:hypothetical protein [Nitrosophilus labii]
MSLIRFFTFLTILFAGCSDIYTKIYDKELAKKPISCINIKSDNLIIEDIVKKNSFIKKIYKKECPYTLKITSNYVTFCSSPKAKALGSDFDGFVRFEIVQSSHLVYRNQRDFKGKFDENVADSLINKMRRDLKFEY